MALFPPSIHSLSSVDQITLKHEVSHFGHILIALGVIALIGSLVANGVLYSPMGNASFAIGGSGIAVCILCVLISKARFSQDNPVLEKAEESTEDYHSPVHSIDEVTESDEQGNFKREVQEVKADVEEQGRQIQELKADVEELKADVEEQGRQIQEVKADVEEQERQIKACGVKIETHMHELMNLEREVTEFASQLKDDAATQIQSLIRRHIAFQKSEAAQRHALSAPLFAEAKKYTEDQAWFQLLPCAPQGKTSYHIRMPKDLPVVIRSCQNDRERNRFPKMKQALHLCEEKHLTHLTVPKARMQGDFIVEEKLPNENETPLKGMAFYSQNRAFYTDAVQEFTTFLYYAELGDIVGETQHRLHLLHISEIPRFDNLLLYAVCEGTEKSFKIGIIDIEKFSLRDSIDGRADHDVLIKCVQLFPYHVEEILAVGRSFADVPGYKIQEVHEAAAKAKQLYEVVYDNNVAFYERNKIAPEHQVLVPITPARKEVLKQHMGHFVQAKIEEGKADYDLGGDPDLAMKCLTEQLIPFMLDLIEDELKDDLATACRKNPLSPAELIESRSIFEAVTCALRDKLKISDSRGLVAAVFKCRLAPTYNLFEEILKQMVVGGELSYYKSRVYSFEDVIFF